MNQEYICISVSDNSDIRMGWRVRAFTVLPNPNTFGKTLYERNYATKKAATDSAWELKSQYPSAKTQGF